MNRLQTIYVVLALALVLRFCRLHLRRWRCRTEAKRRGCGTLPEVGSNGPFGARALEIYKILKALYHRTNSESFVQWSDSTGKEIHTCRYNRIGDELILTRDPENLKAICVSQVNDYDFGTDRMAMLEPLIGTGVLNNSSEA